MANERYSLLTQLILSWGLTLDFYGVLNESSLNPAQDVSDLMF